MSVKDEKRTAPLLEFGPIKDTMSGIIKVIGVGGGGCNAVRNMYKEGVQGVTYAVCNTDSQSLMGFPIPQKLLLGESGLGAGANPELGRSEAESKRDSIEQLLNDGEREIELQPVHKAVYLLFLAHPEGIGMLFDCDRSVVTKHLGNIFESGELEENQVCAKIAHTAGDGKNYNTKFYKLQEKR